MCNMSAGRGGGVCNEAHRLYKFQSIIYLSPRPAAEEQPRPRLSLP